MKQQVDRLLYRFPGHLCLPACVSTPRLLLCVPPAACCPSEPIRGYIPYLLLQKIYLTVHMGINSSKRLLQLLKHSGNTEVFIIVERSKEDILS